MNLPLVFRFSLLLLDLPLQDLQELRFQQHLLNRYEYLNNHLDDLADGKFETNAVRNRNLVIDAFVSVQRQQIFKFSVYLFELLADEFLEKEDIPVEINVEESVEVGSDGPSYLPPVGVLQEIQAVGVRVDVGQLADVDEVFALDQH